MENKNKDKKKGEVISMPEIPLGYIKLLLVLIIVMIIVIIASNIGFNVTGDLIMGLAEFSVTVTLTLVGLVLAIIAIKPSFKSATDETNFHKNLNNYIFSVFLVLGLNLLTYIYGFFGSKGDYDYIFIISSIISIIFVLTRSLVLLIASYNIDGKNPKK
jgi:hypothetical protein